MKIVKKYMTLVLSFFLYVVAVTILLKSYYVYQSAYHKLSRLISHPSVEVQYGEEE